MKKKSKQPFHLIIDGPDSVGKTTVIRLLRDRLKIPVIKMKRMPDFFKNDPESASRIFNETIVQFRTSDFILDRGYPSSIVYSTVYRRKCNNQYLRRIEKLLEPHIVILTTRAPRCSDKLVDIEHWYKIRNEYLHQAKLQNWSVIDTSKLTPQQVCNEILRII